MVREKWRNSPIGKSIAILTYTDQRKILAVTVLQVSMGVLDLLGVVAIGLLGALSVTGLQAHETGNRITWALDVLQLSNLPIQKQAMFIGLAAMLLLVGRTILSIFFTRRTIFFLSRRGAQISANLVSRLLSKPLLTIQERTTQEMLFAVTRGVELVVIQVIAPLIIVIADSSLLLIMSVGLFIVNPLTSLGAFVVFSLIGYFLHRYMSSRAGELGNRNTELNITSNLKIVEAFGSYRELVVRHRRDYYAREISKLRFALAETTGDLYFMPYVSKYIIEITVILGALLIGAVQFILQDATHAISTLAIFLAAGTRIAPAILRVQQGVIQIRSSIGQATPTLELVNALGNEVLNENSSNLVDIFHEGFISEISISNITFTYPSKTAPTLDGVNFEITPGTSVAIVGPSGAGKTSLIDIMLGVLNPDKGEVLISGLPPSAAIAKWPGAIAYVPQDVMIAAGTIRENVGLGYPMEEITDELLKSALKISHLEDFVSKLPGGADAQVGERGALISGGQRQRLGIARAMFTRPHILVLDEATSSLDSETESSISDAIQGLRGSTTVVMIAHRLSTIKDADQVIYLAEGKVIAHGSFDYVREAVPDFDRQAKLMGL